MMLAWDRKGMDWNVNLLGGNRRAKISQTSTWMTLTPSRKTSAPASQPQVAEESQSQALIVFFVFKWQHGFTRLFVLLPHDCAEAYCVAQIEIISRYIGSSLHWCPFLLNKKDATTKRQQRWKVPYASFVISRQLRNKRKMRLDSLAVIAEPWLFFVPSSYPSTDYLDQINFSNGIPSLATTLQSLYITFNNDHLLSQALLVWTLPSSTCLTTHSLPQPTITRPLFTTSANVVTVFATNVVRSKHQLSSLDFVEDVYVRWMLCIQILWLTKSPSLWLDDYSVLCTFSSMVRTQFLCWTTSFSSPKIVKRFIGHPINRSVNTPQNN